MKRSARRGEAKAESGASLGLRALRFLAALGLAASAIHCRAERLLEELGLSDGIELPPPPTEPSGSARRPDRPPPPSPHLELGTPVRMADKNDKKKGPPDEELMLKRQYALSYSRSRGAAMWVSWQLDATWFGPTPRYRGKFITDDMVPAGWPRVKHDDYTRSGYDRGHMVRSEERTRGAEDNKATFLMTNILPQRHDLNAGPWLRLEETCQDLAQRQHHTLFVMAGPLFGAKPKKLARKVDIPEGFYKIVVILGDRGQGLLDVTPSTEVIAAIMPNDEGIRDKGWDGYRTSVDEVEKRSGYDFLTDVPEEIQQVIEARTGPPPPPAPPAPDP